ncbi:hypothetical protein ACS3SW_09400 [Roseobacteraceae bacterium S113]
MSFVREDARAALWRWREVLAGLALAGLGLWWLLRSVGLLYYVSFPVLAIAAGLLWAGVPRGRFRGTGGGPGVVQVVERRVSYFGPLTGGIVDLEDLDSLLLDATGFPAHWVLRARGTDPLHIPVTASGAEELFDAFQTLPNLSTARLMEAKAASDGTHIVWRRAQ